MYCKILINSVDITDDMQESVGTGLYLALRQIFYKICLFFSKQTFSSSPPFKNTPVCHVMSTECVSVFFFLMVFVLQDNFILFLSLIIT